MLKRKDWLGLVGLFNNITVPIHTPYLKIHDLVRLAERMCQLFEEALLNIDLTVQELREHRQNVLHLYNVLETTMVYIPDAQSRLVALQNKVQEKREVYQQLFSAVQSYRNNERIQQYLNIKNRNADSTILNIVDVDLWKYVVF